MMDYDYDSVCAELVEAAALWRRSPRVGPRGYKTSWPDYVHVAALGDYGEAGAENRAEAPRPLPLTRDEVAWRDDVSGWLAFIPVEEDRRLVALVSHMMAQGHSQIPWRRVLRALKLMHGEGGLKRRYYRGIHLICAALNKGNG